MRGLDTLVRSTIHEGGGGGTAPDWGGEEALGVEGGVVARLAVAYADASSSMPQRCRASDITKVDQPAATV